MSKKDKDKRKKGEGKEGGSAWMGDLRRPFTPGETERPRADPARGSSPPPVPGDEDLFEMRIPPLRPVTLEPRSAEDLGEETLADIAPIGPTEFAGGLSPESVAAPPEAARPAASMVQLEQQIRDLEARLDEMISRGGHHEAPTRVGGHQGGARRAARGRGIVAGGRHRPGGGAVGQRPGSSGAGGGGDPAARRSRARRAHPGPRQRGPGHRARSAPARLLPAPVGAHRPAQAVRGGRRVRPRSQVRGAVSAVLRLPLQDVLPRRGRGHREHPRRGPLPRGLQPLRRPPALRRHHAAHHRAPRAPHRARAALARRGLRLLPPLRGHGDEPARRGARLPGERGAPARRRQPGRRLPRGRQGHRQALPRALPPPALRPRRLHPPLPAGPGRRSCPPPSSAPRRRTPCSTASST